MAARGRVQRRDVIIYALIDPRTTEPRYVGRSKDLKSRLQLHLSEANRGPYSNGHISSKNAWALAEWRRLNPNDREP
jgi:hypothetical protein